MKVAAATDMGRLRDENQDAFRAGGLADGTIWGIVCDGMGGAQDGKLASGIAIDCIEGYLEPILSRDPPAEEIGSAICDAIDLANVEIFTQSQNTGHQMGTTVVCAVVKAGRLYLAHIGDSRAYLLEGHTLKLLTRDHSMVQELVDTGALTPEEAKRHPDKNIITRALGVGHSIEVTYGERSITNGSTLLLCTDGLTNMVPNEVIGQILLTSDAYEAADKLIQAALDAGGEDNIAVVVMQQESEGSAE